jgi:hypothetical protein
LKILLARQLSNGSTWTQTFLKPRLPTGVVWWILFLIETAYDGKVFNVTLADVPEKKADLVQGNYILPVNGGSSVVAVKTIDMLGEELLITSSI